jgi:lipoic acid synthetase
LLPPWLKKSTPKSRHIQRLRKLISCEGLHTVCESAKCPNLGECFARNTLTFLILGEVCTRNCAFCAIKKGEPTPVDTDEPRKIAEAVKKLGLNYVVITSVTRDDLPDGGAGLFKKVIEEIKGIKVEVLIPDFRGDREALNQVIAARPYVINHNLETVSRLYAKVRPQADYQRSLDLLRHIKEADPSIYTKSGIMVGLGERDEEVAQVLRDLKKVSCDMVTIGQYLRPSRQNLQVERFVEPEVFVDFERLGRDMGFLSVTAGPLVRSSYRAGENIPK